LRAAQTRDAIIEASRKLFLERGFAGTRINNITDACGISRAGFYTYFKDKQEVFSLIGEATYREIIEVVNRWDELPTPCSIADVEGWIREYFAFMDRHGAFIFSSTQSAPSDPRIRANSERMQMRVGWMLGSGLRTRQASPTDAPDALGLTTLAMLDRSWFYAHAQGLPVEEADLIRAIAVAIMGILGGPAAQ
jgi:AcrR family transcriptional regulator